MTRSFKLKYLAALNRHRTITALQRQLVLEQQILLEAQAELAEAIAVGAMASAWRERIAGMSHRAKAHLAVLTAHETFLETKRTLQVLVVRE